MAGAIELSKLLDQNEYSTLPVAIKDKIEHQLTLFNTELEESKAKLEKLKVNSGKCVSKPGADFTPPTLMATTFWFMIVRFVCQCV